MKKSILTRAYPWLPAATLLAATLLTAPGCAVLACTAIAKASVSLQLVDAGGRAIDGAHVTFDDGSGPQQCEGFGGGSYVCGWEVAGPMTISVEAEGYQPVELETFVDEDHCHVETVDLEQTLAPLQ